MDARADLLKMVASRPGYNAKVICIDNMPINDDASIMVNRFKDLWVSSTSSRTGGISYLTAFSLSQTAITTWHHTEHFFSTTP